MVVVVVVVVVVVCVWVGGWVWVWWGAGGQGGGPFLNAGSQLDQLDLCRFIDDDAACDQPIG